jgi:small-conductance mechanosensitive channel
VDWERIALAAGVVLVTLVAAKLVDSAIGRSLRSPEVVTRYRVLRRGIVSLIVAIGVLSALLVIPQVRAVAGGILASSAVLGLIIGFASQRTIGNFVAGIMIALTQPLRIGDEVEVAGSRGLVEEIGLAYTFIRLADGARVVIPNEKLASDTIRNATIRAAEQVAEVSVQVPATTDLDAAVEALRPVARGPRDEVFVRSLEGNPVVAMRVWTASPESAAALENDLRLQAHRRLRELGVFTA